MTITLEIRPDLQAELARQAAGQGMGIDAYAANLLEEAVALPVAPRTSRITAPGRDVVEAIELLRNFGKVHGLSLGGMTIRELRHEARP